MAARRPPSPASGRGDLVCAPQAPRPLAGEGGTHAKRGRVRVPDIERHTIAVLVDNEPGILARVVGLFSGRGYNIDSLTVAEVDRPNNLSRITVVTSGTRMIIEQIKAQLSRLVPVRKVHDLTDEGPFVARELALIKVAGRGEHRIESLRLADVFRARVVDSTTESFVYEITGSADKLDAFIGLMEPLGLVEVSRTGAVAIARGPGRF
ncbi:MAG: acetolactate synthase small subunit [Alphaproteobacteria bacterium]|nr:acetolactate synthase small subunit [Alphaproteobacteria bacterium]